jgi:hypothetical protein
VRPANDSRCATTPAKKTKTHKPPQKRKPNLQHGPHPKLPRSSENHAKRVRELVGQFVWVFLGFGGGGEGVEFVAETCCGSHTHHEHLLDAGGKRRTSQPDHIQRSPPHPPKDIHSASPYSPQPSSASALLVIGRGVWSGFVRGRSMGLVKEDVS